MADIGRDLKIKYGLGHDPSPEMAKQWAELVRRYITEGRPAETAGDLAAKSLFRDYQTHFYASEADTIQMLLQQVSDK